jgi:hypothetical protein
MPLEEELFEEVLEPEMRFQPLWILNRVVLHFFGEV